MSKQKMIKDFYPLWIDKQRNLWNLCMWNIAIFTWFKPRYGRLYWFCHQFFNL